jgi:hypothetical protein
MNLLLLPRNNPKAKVQSSFAIYKKIDKNLLHKDIYVVDTCTYICILPMKRDRMQRN